MRLRPPGSDEPHVAVKGAIPIDVVFGERRLRLGELHDILRAVGEVVER